MSNLLFNGHSLVVQDSWRTVGTVCQTVPCCWLLEADAKLALNDVSLHSSDERCDGAEAIVCMYFALSLHGNEAVSAARDAACVTVMEVLVDVLVLPLLQRLRFFGRYAFAWLYNCFLASFHGTEIAMCVYTI